MNWLIILSHATFEYVPQTHNRHADAIAPMASEIDELIRQWMYKSLREFCDQPHRKFSNNLDMEIGIVISFGTSMNRSRQLQ